LRRIRDRIGHHGSRKRGLFWKREFENSKKGNLKFKRLFWRFRLRGNSIVITLICGLVKRRFD